MNCYDLTMDYFRVLANIDEAISRKSEVSNEAAKNSISTEIDRLESEMFAIKNQLKRIGTYELAMKYIEAIVDLDAVLANETKKFFIIKKRSNVEKAIEIENIMMSIREELKSISV